MSATLRLDSALRAWFVLHVLKADGRSLPSSVQVRARLQAVRAAWRALGEEAATRVYGDVVGRWRRETGRCHDCGSRVPCAWTAPSGPQAVWSIVFPVAGEESVEAGGALVSGEGSVEHP